MTTLLSYPYELQLSGFVSGVVDVTRAEQIAGGAPLSYLNEEGTVIAPPGCFVELSSHPLADEAPSSERYVFNHGACGSFHRPRKEAALFRDLMEADAYIVVSLNRNPYLGSVNMSLHVLLEDHVVDRTITTNRNIKQVIGELPVDEGVSEGYRSFTQVSFGRVWVESFDYAERLGDTYSYRASPLARWAQSRRDLT